MATQCNLAPFINQEFYITGTWGEIRQGHIHAGLDLSTGGQNNVYCMKTGTVITVDEQGTSGSGYRAFYNHSKFRWRYLVIWRFRSF